MSVDEQIIELESRIAFQEDAIDKLSDVIARQEQEILRLEKMVQYLNQQVKTMAENPTRLPQDEAPPPHY